MRYSHIVYKVRLSPYAEATVKGSIKYDYLKKTIPGAVLPWCLECFDWGRWGEFVDNSGQPMIIFPVQTPISSPIPGLWTRPPNRNPQVSNSRAACLARPDLAISQLSQIPGANFLPIMFWPQVKPLIAIATSMTKRTPGSFEKLEAFKGFGM